MTTWTPLLSIAEKNASVWRGVFTGLCLCVLASAVLTCTSSIPLHSDPPEEDHGAVMVDMKEGDLVVLLPQNEEHCVQQLYNLREIVPPHDRCHLIGKKENSM